MRGWGTEKGRENGQKRTYFLLLLLISACGSLRRPSSEGGVAELDSFFGRATGMGGKKSQQAERANGALEGNGTVCLAVLKHACSTLFATRALFLALLFNVIYQTGIRLVRAMET
ncbi:hypothetical protein ARMSODRAFT_488530 [Armillaria solidipes]|uniref:Secreted protein n=1 Tax=Armillaria solidipes TaxID=1076256 RepID=A0A2H3CD74_9AGAR|nr:hypothetical protein ARMSODRAFT_488530 [Armillaria solidipes]